jgi:SAM-dependent methyltransferase
VVHDIDWAEHAARLAGTARDDAGWYAAVAAALVRPSDRVLVDVGCGGGGMAIALAAAAPPGADVVALDAAEPVLVAAEANASAAGARVRFAQADIAGGGAALAERIGAPADLVWASAVVHHAPDQQAAVTDLAGLLAPGGRLALAEGGLRPRHLPWDVGIGEPGLEMRLDAAQDRWFAGMRAELPGSVPMPYGWAEALRRAGLTDVTTHSMLLERPPPLAEAELATIAERLRWFVDRMRDAGMLPAEDERTWARLVDPADAAFLGRRSDVFRLEARTVYVGRAKATGE